MLSHRSGTFRAQMSPKMYEISNNSAFLQRLQRLQAFYKCLFYLLSEWTQGNSRNKLANIRKLCVFVLTRFLKSCFGEIGFNSWMVCFWLKYIKGMLIQKTINEWVKVWNTLKPNFLSHALDNWTQVKAYNLPLLYYFIITQCCPHLDSTYVCTFWTQNFYNIVLKS